METGYFRAGVSKFLGQSKNSVEAIRLPDPRLRVYTVTCR